MDNLFVFNRAAQMLTCWWKAKDSKSPSCYRDGRDHALPCIHKNLTACLLSAHTFTAYRKCLQHFVLELKQNQRFHHLFLLCLANFVYHLTSSFVFVLHFVHTVLYFVHLKAKPYEIKLLY